MVNVIILSFTFLIVILNVIKLNVVIMNVVMPNVFMPSVVAPLEREQAGANLTKRLHRNQ
jgi:hypothetical protein